MYPLLSDYLQPFHPSGGLCFALSLSTPPSPSSTFLALSSNVPS